MLFLKTLKITTPTPIAGINYDEFAILYPTLSHLEGTLLEETITSLAFLEKIRQSSEEDLHEFFLHILHREQFAGISDNEIATWETIKDLTKHFSELGDAKLAYLLGRSIVTRNYSYTAHARSLVESVGTQMVPAYGPERVFESLIEHKMIPEQQRAETKDEEVSMRDLANLGVDFDQLILGELPIGTIDTFFGKRTKTDRFLMITLSLLRTLARTDYVSGITPTEATLARYNRLYDYIDEPRISEQFYRSELASCNISGRKKEHLFAATRLNLMLGQSPAYIPFIAEYLKTAHPAYESIIGELLMTGVKEEMDNKVAIIPHQMSSVLRSYRQWLVNHGYDDTYGLYTLRASLDALQDTIVLSRLDITEDEQISHMPFYAVDLSAEILPKYAIDSKWRS